MSKPRILLVGGNKRQRELLERHMHVDELDLRHVFQGSSRANVPQSPDVVIFWTKHCSHKLEESVEAQVDKSVPRHKVANSVDLLKVMIDLCWDDQETTFKHDMQPHPQTGVECAVPKPIIKTKHRLEEFWHDIIGGIEPTAVDPQMDDEDDPMFVGGRADHGEPISAISPELKDLMDPPYASKVTVMIEIEDQESNVVAQKHLTLECDGPIKGLQYEIGNLARKLGESVGEDALKKMNKGSDPQNA